MPVRSPTLTSLLLLITILHAQHIIPEACIEYSQGLCIRCSSNTHSFLNFCYQNIIGCNQYRNGSRCIECDPSISYLQNNSCTLLNNQGPHSELVKRTIYKYGNPGDRYGELNFLPTTFQEVSSDPLFLAMNNYVRKGQYGHYISKAGNPVYSVHYYINGPNHSYKVLY